MVGWNVSDSIEIKIDSGEICSVDKANIDLPHA
jgi:hypothetical protein